jgi:hypothetical protein
MAGEGERRRRAGGVRDKRVLLVKDRFMHPLANWDDNVLRQRMNNFLWWELCPKRTRKQLLMTKALDRDLWTQWRWKETT